MENTSRPSNASSPIQPINTMEIAPQKTGKAHGLCWKISTIPCRLVSAVVHSIFALIGKIFSCLTCCFRSSDNAPVTGGPTQLPPPPPPPPPPRQALQRQLPQGNILTSTSTSNPTATKPSVDSAAPFAAKPSLDKNELINAILNPKLKPVNRK